MVLAYYATKSSLPALVPYKLVSNSGPNNFFFVRKSGSNKLSRNINKSVTTPPLVTPVIKFVHYYNNKLKSVKNEVCEDPYLSISVVHFQK